MDSKIPILHFSINSGLQDFATNSNAILRGFCGTSPVKLAGRHAMRLAKYKPVTGNLDEIANSWNDQRDFVPGSPCIYERFRSNQKNWKLMRSSKQAKLMVLPSFKQRCKGRVGFRVLFTRKYRPIPAIVFGFEKRSCCAADNTRGSSPHLRCIAHLCDSPEDLISRSDTI
jgi:hypothetical protein